MRPSTQISANGMSTARISRVMPQRRSSYHYAPAAGDKNMGDMHDGISALLGQGRHRRAPPIDNLNMLRPNLVVPRALVDVVNPCVGSLVHGFDFYPILLAVHFCQSECIHPGSPRFALALVPATRGCFFITMFLD